MIILIYVNSCDLLSTARVQADVKGALEWLCGAIVVYVDMIVMSMYSICCSGVMTLGVHASCKVTYTLSSK
jgi:hypothetical protein